MSQKALIIMAKRPFPGQTKTRLVPPLNHEEAAELYECFLRDTLRLARQIKKVTPFLAYTPIDQESIAYFDQLAPDIEKLAQEGRTLSERLDGVLTTCLRRGFGQAVAMDSDSPLLPAAYLQAAFDRLDNAQTDIVLGPCADGGYYLIGWKKPHPRLVREVTMSTRHVLADTIKIAAEEQLTVSLLEPHYDVDEEADLRRLEVEIFLNGATAEHTRRFLHQRLGDR